MYFFVLWMEEFTRSNNFMKEEEEEALKNCKFYLLSVKQNYVLQLLFRLETFPDGGRMIGLLWLRNLCYYSNQVMALLTLNYLGY